MVSTSPGYAITALEVGKSYADPVVVDLTCDASDAEHADRINETLSQVEDVSVVVSGVGAAGHAIISLLGAEGGRDIVACGRHGALHRDDEGLSDERLWLAQNTNPRGKTGTLTEVLVGADVFIGVSARSLLDGDAIATMADGAIVFGMSNPDPEVDPFAAREHAAVVATGRSDFPYQINNVLAFPGCSAGCSTPGPSESGWK